MGLPVTWPLPAAMAERAARFLSAGGVPPRPRVAATVVLLRMTRGHIEVYAIRRAATMAFGGMYAFPGGGVDPSDVGPTDVDQPGTDSAEGAADSASWAGPSPQWWARRLRLPVGQARAVVCAAVRELFEEAGVLLTGPSPDTVVRDTEAPRWESARASLAARRQSLTSFLAEAKLLLRSDLLLPWSRWITPEFEPRRFDTYFFLATLPDGQHARDVSGEADHAQWIRLSDAVARQAAGELPMLPPTAMSLRQLAMHGDDLAALWAAAARRDPAAAVLPRVAYDANGVAALAFD